MNDSKNSSKGLLVLRYPMPLTADQIEYLTQSIEPTAKYLGVEPLVLSDGADARLEYGASALLERVCVALEALVAQGQPPEVSEAQIAPQALNQRNKPWPEGAVCKGAAELGTACGQCDRCLSRGSYAQGLSSMRPKPPTAGLNTRG